MITSPAEEANQFHAYAIQPEQLAVSDGPETCPSSRRLTDSSPTHRLDYTLPAERLLQPDPEHDILKLVVVNRYTKAPPAVAFIRNFGLKRGALASSVAHDSHNLIAVGADDDSLALALNLLMDARGGVAAVSQEEQLVLPLPVAGLMSAEDGYTVAEAYSTIDRLSKRMGSKLTFRS